MKLALIILSIFLYTQCFGQDIAVPKGFAIIEQKTGDLDKDGIKEKVVVYNTTDTTEDGIVRELGIFKLKDNKWQLWKKSRHAILKSKEGGMMGEPFEGIDIDKGILSVHFSGGSSWKWSYTDKYRFQNNEFRLVGYNGHYGKLCEYWEDVDFNLITGKIVFNKEFEDCDRNQEIYKKENETFLKKGILLTIHNRNSKDYKIVSPKYKHELYL